MHNHPWICSKGVCSGSTGSCLNFIYQGELKNAKENDRIGNRSRFRNTGCNG